MKKFTKVHPAVLAVWAAVLAVASLLPSIPIIGLGSSFSVSTALYPLAGIFFGPVAGGITAAVGAFIGMLLAPHTAWMGMATFLVGTISAIAAGCVRSKKTFYIPIAIILASTVGWYSFEIGRDAFIFPLIFYSAGVLACIVSVFVAKKGFFSKNIGWKIIMVFVCAYAGMVTTASWANIVTLILFQTPGTVWNVLAFTAPIERAAFSAGTTIIGVPLLIGLPKIGVDVGLKKKDSDESDIEL